MIKFVKSIEAAKSVSDEGNLPAVDVTGLLGMVLSHCLLRLNIRQATQDQIIDSGVRADA